MGKKTAHLEPAKSKPHPKPRDVGPAVSPAPNGNRARLAVVDDFENDVGEDPGAALAAYEGLQAALPADFRYLARAAEAGDDAQVVTKLWRLLPPGLECVPREELVPYVAGALGTLEGPAANANELATLIARNESTRRFLFDKLDADVTIAVVADPNTSWPSLQFSVDDIALVDHDGLLPLDSLDTISITPLAVIVEQEGRAAAQLIDLDVADKHLDYAAATMFDLADQITKAPWQFPFQEVLQLFNALVAAPQRVQTLGTLAASNSDQAPRLASLHARANVAAQKGQSLMQSAAAFRDEHMPDETAGEIYDEAESEGWDEGGWGYLGWFSAKLWHTAGDIATLGNISMQGNNAKLYREGLISWDDYCENQYWNMGKSLVVGVVSAFTAGWGTEAAAGYFSVSAGYTAEGVTVLSSTSVGMGAGLTTSIAGDAYSLLVSKATSSPGVRLEQQQEIGGPKAWLTSTLLGGVAAGTLGWAGSRLRFSGIPVVPRLGAAELQLEPAAESPITDTNPGEDTAAPPTIKRIGGDQGPVDLKHYLGDDVMVGEQRRIDITKGWRLELGDLVEGDRELAYVLRDAETGEVLKVGKTEAANLIDRIGKYQTAGSSAYSGRSLSLDIAQVEPPAGSTTEAVEFDLRDAILRDGDAEAPSQRVLPWDNTGNRLGRAGPGTPGVTTAATRKAGQYWQGEDLVGGVPKPVAAPRVPQSSELVELLKVHKGDVAAAAKSLDVSSSTLYRWLRKAGLAASDYRP